VDNVTSVICAFMLLAGLVSGSTHCTASDDQLECAALVDFGVKLNYTQWLSHNNWLTATTICGWQGIKCKDGRVKEINLKDNNLNGVLPSSLGSLTRLEELKIGASRTAEYTGCSNTAGTNLHYTELPPSLYSIPTLKVIDIEYGCLGGSISPAIGQLSALTNLSLHGNGLTGTVPVEGLNNCTELLELKIGRNPLSGPFPAVTKLKKLVIFEGNFCAFSGPLPDIFDSWPAIYELYWDGNAWTGSLPPSLGKLKNLVELSFNIANLTGPVPESYCNIKSLHHCTLGADTDFKSYQATYPWILPIKGNLFDCPLPKCLQKGGVCYRAKSPPSIPKCK